MRQRSEAELHEEAVVVEELGLEEDLLDHLLRAADEVRAAHAADDRERHRQAERAGTDRRVGVAADGDPDWQRVLERARVDGKIVQSRSVLPGPGHVLGRS